MTRNAGLYDPQFEHGSCGVGFVVNIDGTRSHQIVSDGMTILKNLVHRGAIGSDAKTGDGAGIIIQIPHRFFCEVCIACGITLPDSGTYGVGMLFLPRETTRRQEAIHIAEEMVKSDGGTVLGWRDVPVNPACLGELAYETMPHIAQLFVSFGAVGSEMLERTLYVVRKSIESAAVKAGFTIDQFYIVSFSSLTVTYKGLFVAPQFERFYLDLAHPNVESAFALVHQRYSTNTFPSWPLAQPFRFLAHNGEINTLRGNINKMNAREAALSSELFGADISRLLPVINPTMSDSAIFDNVFELLVRGGRSMEHAMMMMIPEAFGPTYHMSHDKRAFYEYHAAIMEPWDGPAAVAFTDGTKIGAALDRNGLRPARFVLTKSNKLILASEVGVLDVAPADVLQKGRLGPGKMILVNTRQGRVIYDNEIKASCARQKPYRRWLERNRIELNSLPHVADAGRCTPSDRLALLLRVFGYTFEELKMIIVPMVENAQEPVGSMGNHASLAVLSQKSQLLYNYFKQMFAQVTNPPIDPYRENLVMSLMSFIGQERNLLEETPQHCRQLKLAHPILSNDDMNRLRNADIDGLKACVIPMVFPAEAKQLASALDEICRSAERKIDEGYTLLILSDRAVDEIHAPIPALLATSALHQHLVRVRKRPRAALVVESGEVREIMHFASLIGFGASAVCPYLVYEAIAMFRDMGILPPELRLEHAIDQYITAVKKGLLKVMSKMGIATIRSYRGAQTFEAVGINRACIDRYFTGTLSRIGGIGIDEIGQEAVARHAAAFASPTTSIESLRSGGIIHFRRDEERHYLSPEAIVLLQKAVRENDFETYRRYAALMNDADRNLCTLRALFSFKTRTPVPIDEVEPVELIVKRFVTSAMSFGSISIEAHTALATAMNRLGAASNSGEGGEDEERFTGPSNSAIKQVASARFGVTISYLTSARELQIKIAQGAKPGEGGQLPGHKVDSHIAKVRHSTEGVMLISPPPHHDIYSIEDLAQLIYDLKCANPTARVSVKLVAEVGVGTVAAGVAKAKADMVLISGHDGGTGASPISSIQYAGIPWEIGIAETQQTLVLNNLRNRIRVQVDGQLRTGRDIVIAALLGAEEFGFGTIALVALGCVLMRKCHLNTCPVGIATQDPQLRKRFRGEARHVENLMRFLAQDTRILMAQLGFRTFDEMVGRSDVLDTAAATSHWKARGLDFSAILSFPTPVRSGVAVRCTQPQHHDMLDNLDKELIEKARMALEKKKAVNLFATIRNCNRSVGALLSGEISRRWGSEGLPQNTIHCKFKGTAGQSFGAFLSSGVTFELEGDANDYLGKGLSGGRIIVYPPKDATFRSQHNSICGNVCLFGATGGEVFISGMAGERFAVRNSGAIAVVEGVGDHACEYMTGGRVIVLGETGINFAAGMSGGIAYVLDENQLFDTKCNLEMVDLEPVQDDEDRGFLNTYIHRHVKYTGSRYAERIIRDWIELLPLFVKVIPIEYRQALERIHRNESRMAENVVMTEEVFK